MKKLFFYIALFLGFLEINAQVLIQKAEAPSNVNTSAILELRSQNEALLVPRFTSQEVSNLGKNLPSGLVVFNVDSHQLIGWNGKEWVHLLQQNTTPPPEDFNGYYASITSQNLSGYALKTALSELISKNYKDNGYNGLYDTYRDSDNDVYYENDNTVLDIYSENPTGADPYNFKHGIKQCGNYSNEGDCYNREHIIPQSLFNKHSPMRNDAHFVIPTDGKVNGLRGSYSFGNVNIATNTSLNGSKLGKDLSGNTVFEPIDEFKGDVARMVFYFVTRYEDKLPTFKKGQSILKPSDKHQGIDDKLLKVLKAWHKQDPVSQREKDRNNAVQARQNNRNPFIDHPEWVSAVWGD